MTSIQTIDINADLGEHDGGGYSRDEDMLDVVSSASIACGAHAGSRAVMDRTVEAAAERGVAIGAHPSYPDREGFGRVEIDMPIDQVLRSVREQIESLADCCGWTGARLSYVKPHGALYNRAARDTEMARALVECVIGIDPGLVMLALAGSVLEEQSRFAGLVTAGESFIDRAYTSEGRLVPRERKGAVITDPDICASRAVEMARDGCIRTIDGVTLSVTPASLCVHGDSRNALEIVIVTRRRLEEAGFIISRLSH